MRVAIVRHDSADHPGWIAPALESAGLSWHYWESGELGRPQAWLLLGGSGSANDAHLIAEVQLIQRAVAAGTPVLGVCLGAQLIAKALGSKVYRNRETEIGWAPIRFTDDAHDDALFDGFTVPETVFHWHSDTFDLPEGAVRLASSDACQNQAFRYGSNVYGLQFHLEATPDIIERWQQEDRACVTPELNRPVDPLAGQEQMSRAAAVVFGRWASLVSSRSASHQS
jgi:GMP synthase (glutamine-hydrolysing)